MFSIILHTVHKANGGDLWRMRLEPSLFRLYRNINQLLASNKIGCSGSECFENLNEIHRILAECQLIEIFTSKHCVFIQTR